MQETISGEIEHISYHNAENDYTVARLRTLDTDEKVTVVGHLSGVHQGETLRLTGLWKNHPRFGRQFAVESFETIYPETVEGIEKYLGSGLIKGIGPKTAEKIVSLFGRETLEVIEMEPEKLRAVQGLGRKKIAMIRSSWEEQRGLRKLMIFLQGHGIGGALAVRIYRQYREKGMEIVSRNPYRLAEEVRGIGFATADRIAESLGIARDSPLRIRGGLGYTAELAQERGHSCMPRDFFLRKASELLSLDRDILEPAMAELEQFGILIVEKDDTSSEEYIFSSVSYWAEKAVAEGLARIIKERDSSSTDELGKKQESTLKEFETRMGLRLSGEQKKAVINVLRDGAAVVTGGPGTGKTTIIAAIVSIMESEKLSVVLTAPTGRAAKRMSETTGAPASTIHRLLGWSFTEGKFLHHAGKPLKGDVFVVDEVSMVDLYLFASLVEALPTGCFLILVGDVDQLPSIGPGRVLADLISCRCLPVYRLRVIFRQSRNSLIIHNAHRVREGRLPVEACNRQDQTPAAPGTHHPEADNPDFFFVSLTDPRKALDMVVRLATERLEPRFGIDPMRDLQVITPMNRGVCGTRELNARLQQALNPSGSKVPFTGRDFRIGDRVMQVRNDYEKDIYNGDIGCISSFDTGDETITVDFEGRPVEYDTLELDDLVVAYAVTVHKSQGCEYPAVILTIMNEHYVMLRRNLLYTAISRGRDVVVLIGDTQAVTRAVENATEQFRYSRLAKRIYSALN